MTLDWNPWEHPCVPVLTPASNRAVYGKLSLIDTFRRSEEITDLYGDTLVGQLGSPACPRGFC